MTCKDCIHYCVCKDTVADENWTDEAPEEIKAIFSPQGCENFTATADVAPVKHGEWVEHHYIDRNGRENGSYYECSECGFDRCDEDYPYCPECGACMDGGK